MKDSEVRRMDFSESKMISRVGFFTKVVSISIWDFPTLCVHQEYLIRELPHGRIKWWVFSKRLLHQQVLVEYFDREEGFSEYKAAVKMSRPGGEGMFSAERILLTNGCLQGENYTVSGVFSSIFLWSWFKSKGTGILRKQCFKHREFDPNVNSHRIHVSSGRKSSNPCQSQFKASQQRHI